MLGRILSDSFVRRRRRKLLSLVTVALGVTVATAVGSIAVDVGDKVNRELRSFGANLTIEPAADTLAATLGGVDYRPVGGGSYLAESDLVKLRKIFWSNNIVAFAPYLSVPVELHGRRTVLTGAWFDHPLEVGKSEVFRTGLKELHPTWRLDGAWPNAGEVVVGRRLASSLGLEMGQTVAFALGDGKRAEWTVRGFLETGGAQEDEIFAPLEQVQRLADLEGKIRRVEVSALTKPDDAFARSDVTKLTAEQFDRWYCTPYAAAIAYQIEQAIPGAQAKPVYEVAETEGKILDRFGLLMALVTGAALGAAALAVASIMLATVLERRVEIGLFKSLGASDARVATIFLIEAVAVGAAGGLLGYAAGTLAARLLSQNIFGSPVGVHWLMLPAAVALAVLVTLAGSAWPLGRGLKVSPAVVLRD